MQTILITGGTGTIGQRLTKMLLEKNYKVIILTRGKPVPPINPSLSYAYWDIGAGTIDADAIAKADHIIHLAGAGVADKRWTEKRKKEIVRSRTESSALLVKALSQFPNSVKTVISSSAIGWYGPDTAESRKNGFREETPADKAFLGETCRLWESSIDPVTSLGKRLVKLRTGIVLSNRGGAFVEFKKPLKAFVAMVLGRGKQVISWIHEEDLCRIFLHAIENESVSGVYNAVAPSPVTNKNFITELAKQMHGRFYLPVPVPAFILKVMLGEMSIEVLKSATVNAEKIQQTGFSFQYPTADKAIAALLAE